MKYTFLVGTGIFLLSGWLMGNLAVAAESKPVLLTLRVLVDGPPPCSVKGSNVQFGEVYISKINGTNYRTTQPLYTLNCSSRASGVDDLRMQLKGTTTVINGETVIATEIPGLAFALKMVPITLCSEWVKVTGLILMLTSCPTSQRCR